VGHVLRAHSVDTQGGPTKGGGEMISLDSKQKVRINCWREGEREGRSMSSYGEGTVVI
jgi:hypothetical protein